MKRKETNQEKEFERAVTRKLKAVAERIDEHGKRVWKEHEQEFRSAGRRAGYVATAAVNGVLIYIFLHLLVWNIPFLTNDFNDVLPAIVLSLGVTIAANVVLLFDDPIWLRHLFAVVTNSFGAYSAYLLYRIFPFDFSLYRTVDSLTPIIHLLLLIGYIATLIGIAVSVVQLLVALSRGLAKK